MAAEKSIRLRLNKRLFRRKTFEEVKKNMRVATVFVRDRVKEKLNRGQPTRTTPGGSIIGLDPSLPGEPPKKITSQLQNSIRQRVVSTVSSVTGLIGTDLKKGAALELGNRSGTLKPRPFLRPTLMEQRRKILRILAKGLAGV